MVGPALHWHFHMIIKTIFNHGGQWERGEIEIHLLPGIPNLHVVGLPDAQIKESGIKLKSALKSCGFSWPKGSQIIVNLRPNHFRKSSAGGELAIALGFLAKTNQLSETVLAAAKRAYVYGEVALDGRVIAPHDLASALRTANGEEVLTGVVGENVREGLWSEISGLKSEEVLRKQRFFDWENFWQPPKPMGFPLHPEAAKLLLLAAHMKLHVLLAGPQGSGKSTWAKTLYSLTEPPDPDLYIEREALIGREELRWKPLEQPHHSLTPLAMVGGGYPIAPGVISRAHGGILVMDEFLEFDSAVLENLREPLETGRIEIARKGAREILPAKFQLIGTTNLCPCGQAAPGEDLNCPHFFRRKCSSIVHRLSGPLLDRFDLLGISHNWIDRSEKMIPVSDVKKTLARLAAFRKLRGADEVEIPSWVDEQNLSYRKRSSIAKVARGLADIEDMKNVESKHFAEAIRLVQAPITALQELFS